MNELINEIRIGLLRVEVDDMKKECDSLREVNAELLAAAEEILRWKDGTTEYDVAWCVLADIVKREKKVKDE